MRATSARACLTLLLLLAAIAEAPAAVIGVEIRARQSFGSYERLVGRVFFAVDPALPANRGIADLQLAPRNAHGLVEFSSDVVVFRATGARARGTAILEPANRGHEQSLGLLSGADNTTLPPDRWTPGDAFLLQQGFVHVLIGWQFDVKAADGLTFATPRAPVRGLVRASFVATTSIERLAAFGMVHCAADPLQSDARLTFRTRLDEPARVLTRDTWRFGPGGCSVQSTSGFQRGVYEVLYQAEGSPVAGLGLAAVRDLAAYLKHGVVDGVVRERAGDLTHVIAFGYSQSARLLREFVRDGFNAAEDGRRALDGLFIASAGAGGGSFNHRFAQPGEGGNSVLSALRPVDVPPFTDDQLLARARSAGVVPRIVSTFTSGEYWARSASLTHTTLDGTNDVPLDPSSRLYLLTGTPHATGPFPPSRAAGFAQPLNFAQQRWTLRALVMALEAWVAKGLEPPPSRYPTTRRRELVPIDAVRFPRMPSLGFPRILPPVWAMDFGETFVSSGVITEEPPRLGREFRVLVPQVDDDGNDRGGVALPEIAVPLGTFTGWNISVPPQPELRYLAGLAGSFRPFPLTEADRDRAADDRRSIQERYTGRDDYLARVTTAVRDLVRQRLLLGDDVKAVVARAAATWDAVVAGR